MLDSHRESVDEMLAKKVPFTDIEDRINSLVLDEEGRSALWLYAAAHADTRLFFTVLRPDESLVVALG